ncbi:MAG: zinc-ribbon domain-containing protein [Firmicutes bacterium]|nr:zinc-ribbon domain-containing protein [Bacillota bacterium]
MPHCTRCGTKIAENVQFCPNCGTQQPAAATQQGLPKTWPAC